tara:strand:+ start:1436 stop:1882 length:447 start_codon:yes stop_codon:yes gene_type:complete
MDKKQQIIAAMYAFIGQRPGLEYGNYGEPVSYRAEVRAIGKDLTQARQLLRYVELRNSISADDILAAAKGAYSGRLTIVERDDGAVSIDYCTGQYFPTEYRKAACAVLAQAIRAWYRTCISDTANPGDYLRASFKREFGRGMAARWFD